MLHDMTNGVGLVLAPSHEDDLLGAHHRVDAHGYGSGRCVLEVAVEVLGLALS